MRWYIDEDCEKALDEYRNFLLAFKEKHGADNLENLMFWLHMEDKHCLDVKEREVKNWNQDFQDSQLERFKSLLEHLTNEKLFDYLTSTKEVLNIRLKNYTDACREIAAIELEIEKRRNLSGEMYGIEFKNHLTKEWHGIYSIRLRATSEEDAIRVFKETYVHGSMDWHFKEYRAVKLNVEKDKQNDETKDC